MLVGTAAGLVINPRLVLGIMTIALVSAVVLGYPTYLLLRRLGWLRPWQLALTGLLLVSPWIYMAGNEWVLGSVIGLSGALAGIVFLGMGIAEPPRDPRRGA